MSSIPNTDQTPSENIATLQQQQEPQPQPQQSLYPESIRLSWTDTKTDKELKHIVDALFENKHDPIKPLLRKCPLIRLRFIPANFLANVGYQFLSNARRIRISLPLSIGDQFHAAIGYDHCALGRTTTYSNLYKAGYEYMALLYFPSKDEYYAFFPIQQMLFKQRINKFLTCLVESEREALLQSPRP